MLIKQTINQAIFHGLPEDGDENFLHAAIFLAQKISQQDQKKSKIILLCEPEDLEFLDQGLWALIPESFLPHSLELDLSQSREIYLTSTLPEVLPERISHQEASYILIYLSQEPPSIYLNKIHEIHHVVGKNPAYREFCRTLFREYKKSGIKIDYIDYKEVQSLNFI